MKIISSAFEHNGSIPAEHTCDGPDASPPIAWSEVPAAARSLVLIVDDPDAPDPKAPTHTHVHWILYDIQPSLAGLSAGLQAPPAGSRLGVGDGKRPGYSGPCPPVGRHRYFFKLYALDTLLGDLGSPAKGAVEKAMQGHIIAQSELIGTYERHTPAGNRD